MTVYDPEKLYDLNYTLGALCSEFLEQFGKGAENIIRQICSQRGFSLGKVLASKLEKKSFEKAVIAFVAASENSEAPAELVSLDKNKAIIKGFTCPLGLNARGRKICEAMMSLDTSILEEASGEKVKCTVLKTLSAKDDYCEVIFEAVWLKITEIDAG